MKLSKLEKELNIDMSIEKVRLTRPTSNGDSVIYPETESAQITDFADSVRNIVSTSEIGNNAYVFTPPDYYYRPSLFSVSSASITIPAGTTYTLNDYLYKVTTNTTVSIPSSITVASRSGKDLYVYAVENGSYTPSFIISMNSTYPDGYTAATSRKLGGFHCECVAVGTISGHSLNGLAVGSIIPTSAWDLWHRPECNPEGMVYSQNLNLWVDIYLSSVSGSKLASVYGGTIADGTSATKFHWYKFAQWVALSGKRLPTQEEFISFSTGSNQGTNINNSADPVTTGGHYATGNIRMISNIGCEDCCGCHWQWGLEAGGPYGEASWSNAFDENDDSGQKGQHYNVPNRAPLGGFWSIGAVCGSRSSNWSYSPLYLNSYLAARGVCSPKVIPQLF